MNRLLAGPWASFAGIFVVTNLGLLAIGATLPVLPRYLEGPLDASNFEIAFVTGAFAITGLVCRPLAGSLADRRGRRPTVVLGALLAVVAGALLFVPAGIFGLIASRLFLGAGEGTVFTAGSAWVVDMAPPERRGRMIGLYGLSIWTGLTLGPPIGELLLHAGGYHLVWAFAAAAPLLGVFVALRLPEGLDSTSEEERAGPIISREAIRPGIAFALSVVGFAAVSAFLVLHLDKQGIHHGAAVFTAFAGTVVATRIVGGDLPDRIGPARCAIGAGSIEAVGLLLLGLGPNLAVVMVGAVAMGAAFSTLFPALSLIAVERVPPHRRGATMGTFTACFDLGFGSGSLAIGLAALLGGYVAAFVVGAAAALGCAILAHGYVASRAAAPQAAH